MLDGNVRGQVALWAGSGTAPQILVGPGAVEAIGPDGWPVGTLVQSGNGPRFSAVRWLDCDATCFPADLVEHLGDLPGSMPLMGGGSFGSQALDVNRDGTIVGVSDVAQAIHAFVWTADSGMVDLNARVDPADPLYGRLTLESANAINDAGWIVGSALVGGVQHAVVLTPVPEPPAAALVVVGLFVVGLRGRFRWQVSRTAHASAPLGCADRFHA